MRPLFKVNGKLLSVANTVGEVSPHTNASAAAVEARLRAVAKGDLTAFAVGHGHEVGAGGRSVIVVERVV